MSTTRNPLQIHFAQLTRERLALGQSRYGDRHLTGPSLMPLMAEEAADAFNYVAMEAARTAGLDLPADDAAALGTLRGTLQFYGENVLRSAGDQTPFADFAAARMRPPAADEYRKDAWKTRLNLPEAVEELADLHVLSRLEIMRLLHQDQLTKGNHHSVKATGDVATSIAVIALELAERMPPVPVAEAPNAIAGSLRHLTGGRAA